MITQDEWKDDPLVLVQDAIWPPCWIAAAVLVTGCTDREAERRLLDAFDRAIQMLRFEAARLMTGYGVTIVAEDQGLFDQTAASLELCRGLMLAACRAQGDKTASARASAMLFEQTQPAVGAAIDHLRKIFISLVLRRQEDQARQTRSAIAGLDRISKQIFFISINASVEAARAGEAGRGFLQISTDIRGLSQSAQNATRELSNLVAGNRHAI